MNRQSSQYRSRPIVLLEPEINPITARIGLTTFATYPPLAQARLAGQIQDNNIQIVDLRLSGEKRRFLKGLGKEKPALVGISDTFTSNGDEALGIASEIRKRSPHTVIVLGGTAPSEDPDSFYDSDVDFICFRGGDRAFSELVHTLRHGGEVPKNPPGFFYRSEETWRMGPTLTNFSISELRPYAWHLIPSRYWRHYVQAFRYTGLSQTSEGCPFDCNFCSVWITHGRRINLASLENVKHDLNSLPAFTNHFFFADDIWMQGSEKQLQTLYDQLLSWLASDYLKRRPDFKFTAETRTDLFLRERDRFQEWTNKGNLQRVFFGVEAVTDEQLKGFSKRNTVDHNSEAIRVAAEMGLHVTVQLVIPCDATKEYFEEIVRFFKAHRKWIRDANYTIATPLPGTELYKDMLEQYPDLADRTQVTHPAFALFTALTPTQLDPEEFYHQVARLYHITTSLGAYRIRNRNPWKKLIRRFALVPKMLRSARLYRALTRPETFLDIHRAVQGERLLTRPPQIEISTPAVGMLS